MARIILRGNQPAQHNFLLDRGPGESLYCGGLGSGKTWAGSRKLLALHHTNKCDSFAAAPTNGDLWRIVVPALTGLLDRWGQRYELRKSDPYSLAVWGNIIWLLSCDKPERFAGFEAGAGWVDEAARTKAHKDPTRSTPIQIRTRIRSPKAQVLHLLLTTTPEGPDTWTEDDFPLDNSNPRRRRYTGATRLNSALAEGQAENYAAGMPAQLAAQYLEGKAVRFALDRAHPGFDVRRHVRPCPVDPDRPLHIGMDWNVSPLCWVALQERYGGLVVVDELIIADHAQVDRGIAIAHGKGWGQHPEVVIHPDRTGAARSMVGDPALLVAEQTAKQLGWRVRVDRQANSNPPLVKRINHLDMLIDPAAGSPRLLIDPKCARVIDELCTTGRSKGGAYDPGTKGDRGHILDALGYPCWNLVRPLGAMAAG